MTHMLEDVQGDLQATTNIFRVDPAAPWTEDAATKTEPTVFFVGRATRTHQYAQHATRALGVTCRHMTAAQPFFKEACNTRPACVLTSDPQFHSLAQSHQMPLPIIVISEHLEVSDVIRLTRDDTVTVLESPCQENELAEAIGTALRADARQWQATNRLQALRARESALSPRERQVLMRVMDGRPNKSIARELDVTQRTVENIRARVMTKFQATSVVHLTRSFTELQLLEEFLSVQRPTSQDVQAPPVSA